MRADLEGARAGLRQSGWRSWSKTSPYRLDSERLAWKIPARPSSTAHKYHERVRFFLVYPCTDKKGGTPTEMSGTWSSGCNPSSSLSSLDTATIQGALNCEQGMIVSCLTLYLPSLYAQSHVLTEREEIRSSTETTSMSCQPPVRCGSRGQQWQGSPQAQAQLREIFCFHSRLLQLHNQSFTETTRVVKLMWVKKKIVYK
jgi:hypothetical protein